MKTRIIESTESAYQYPLLIKSLLLSGKRYGGENEIVYSDVIRYNYSTLYQRICKLANVLKDLGIKGGDTVAVMDWDSHRYLEAYFAVPMIGAVLHHINVRLSPEQISYTINHAEDDLLLVHDDFITLAEKLNEQLPTVKGYVQLTDSSPKHTSNLNVLGEYESLLEQADDHYDFPDFDENSMATTFYTTGTTGNPKGVYFSHRQLVLHTLNMATTLGLYQGQPLLRSDDVYMPMTPMFHVHAWGVPYVATMIGVKQVYPGRYEPNKLVQLYRDEKVTFSHGVPTVLQMILASEQAKTTDLTGWKMLTGGSAPTQGLAQEMCDRGIEFFTAYGMSESCPLISCVHLNDSIKQQPLEQQLPQRICAGTPVGLVDVRIIDAEGKDMPQDGEAVGEVLVRAPWLTQGYYKEPEKSELLWKDGWLHTGDVASINPKGVLVIKDRIKDVIKTGGEWVSSLELENLISQHEEVSQVAVIGVPDEKWDERPYALVVPTAESNVDSQVLKTHLKQYVEQGRINKWAIPQHFKIVSDIPKTSVGKIDKKRIRLEVV